MQSTFLCRTNGTWVRLSEGSELKGGQGTAPRLANYKPVGRLGVNRDGSIREDKHLPEIASVTHSRTRNR